MKVVLITTMNCKLINNNKEIQNGSRRNSQETHTTTDNKQQTHGLQIFGNPHLVELS